MSAIQDFDLWRAQWLMGMNRAYQSVLVSYARPSAGQSTAGPIPAKVGRTPYESENETGMVLAEEFRDFIVSVGDLVLGGAAAKPARGDRITDSAGNIWEVILDRNRNHYQDVERDTGFRIHTKRAAS